MIDIIIVIIISSAGLNQQTGLSQFGVFDTPVVGVLFAIPAESAIKQSLTLQ